MFNKVLKQLFGGCHWTRFSRRVATAELILNGQREFYKLGKYEFEGETR